MVRRAPILQFTVAAWLLAFLAPMLFAQGSVQTWGDPTLPPVDTDFIQVDGGSQHYIGLRADGSIEVWGSNWMGLIADAPTGTDFVQVSAGSAHNLALRTDGSIVGWGNSGHGATTAPPGTDFTQVSAGNGISSALRSDGSILSWGQDFSGHVSNSPGGTGYVQVDLGFNYGLALLGTGGSIVGWGTNTSAQISDAPGGLGFTKVAAGERHSLALRLDGSIAAWGSDTDGGGNDLGQVSNSPSGSGYTSISAGSYHSLALASDGTIAAWGVNDGSLHDFGQVTSAPAGSGFVMATASYSGGIVLHGESSGDSFCYGDGSGASCPCGATGSPGEGCGNSSGAQGAKLVGWGVPSLSADHFRLSVRGLPVGSLGLILMGNGQIFGGQGSPVGEGLLCVGGVTFRSQVQQSFPAGVTFVDFNGTTFGNASFGLGMPTTYQYWYRDTNNQCAGAGFNFSNGWATTWLP